MREFRNILVIQTAFIGDAILASSVVEKLHGLFPAAAISILVRKGNESLYHHHPYLTEVLVWDKRKNKFRNLLRLLNIIRERKFDSVINCHRYASSGLLAGFSGASHVAGYKENPFSFMFNYTVRHVIGDGRHEIERYNELVADFAGEKPCKPRLYPSLPDYETVAHYKNQPYVCLAPASVWFTKQLPVKKWIDLCDNTRPALAICLLGSPEDRGLCDEIRRSTRHSLVHNLAGELSLLQSCALMKNAQMNYVNDSAPLHLASSVNAPVTAFFLSTVPEFGFGPLSDLSTIIGADGLECRPCGLHGFKACPLGHFRCGTEIPIGGQEV